MTIIRDDIERPESLDLSSETLAYIVLKARTFDAQTPPADSNEASNAADDRGVAILESIRDDATAAELSAAIVRLSQEQQVSLVALVWIGRGDFEASEWEDVRTLARQRHQTSTVRYLMGMPLLGDYIEEGAAALGLNLTDEESNL
jgi:hypothetical protein